MLRNKTSRGTESDMPKLASLFGLLVMTGFVPAALAGKDYRKDVPKAAPAITDVLKGP
jgi:hypothetical protein